MTESNIRSGEEILKDLGEEQTATAFDLIALARFLRDSIISSDYKPSGKLSSAIHPNPAGIKAITQIQKDIYKRENRGSPGAANRKGGHLSDSTKEAHIMLLLELGNRAPLIDLTRTDIEQLREAISDEIVQKRIRHPYVFGSGLYEKAAALFPDLVSELSYEETLSLLEGSPQGVFQADHWLSGPGGLYRVNEARLMPPVVTIPLQHCHDYACSDVHGVRLSTASGATVNRHRDAMQSYIAKELPDKWDWNEAFKLTQYNEARFYDDRRFSNILPLLGDGLDLTEKRLLLQTLIEANQESYRKHFSQDFAIGYANDHAESLDEAACLQQIMTFNDDEIVRRLDSLSIAQDRQISIPAGEIRKPVIARTRGLGYFRTRVELSRYGIRATGGEAVAVLRLDAMLTELYGETGEHGEYLRWKVRKWDGADWQSKINTAMMRGELVYMLESLILDTRQNAEKACLQVGLDEVHIEERNLPELIAWKLGFSVPLEKDVYLEFMSQADRLMRAVGSATQTVVLLDPDRRGVEHRAVGEISTSFFVDLEGLLREVIGFTTWALARPHLYDSRPFVYDPDDAFTFACVTLNALTPDGQLINHDKPTLRPLLESLKKLAELISSPSPDYVDGIITEEHKPKVAKHSRLHRPLFTHNTLLGSIDQNSRRSLSENIEAAATSMINADIAKHRNALLHYRRDSQELRELNESIRSTVNAVQSLDSLGCVPAVSHLEKVERGRWGRSNYTLSVVDGRRSLILSQPSKYIRSPMPPANEDQILLTGAFFTGTDEVPGFRLGSGSPYTRMWEAVPQRRRSTAPGRFSEAEVSSEVAG